MLKSILIIFILVSTVGQPSNAEQLETRFSGMSVLNNFRYELLNYNYNNRTFTVKVSGLIAAGNNVCHSRFVLPSFHGESHGATLHLFASIEERQVEIDPPCDYTYNPQYKMIETFVNLNLNSQNKLSVHNIDSNGRAFSINSCELTEMFCSGFPTNFARRRCKRRISNCR